MRWLAHYNHVLTVGASREGLYLASICVFRPGPGFVNCADCRPRLEVGQRTPIPRWPGLGVRSQAAGIFSCCPIWILSGFAMSFAWAILLDSLGLP